MKKFYSTGNNCFCHRAEKGAICPLMNLINQRALNVTLHLVFVNFSISAFMTKTFHDITAPFYHISVYIVNKYIVLYMSCLYFSCTTLQVSKQVWYFFSIQYFFFQKMESFCDPEKHYQRACSLVKLLHVP